MNAWTKSAYINSKVGLIQLGNLYSNSHALAEDLTNNIITSKNVKVITWLWHFLDSSYSMRFRVLPPEYIIVPTEILDQILSTSIELPIRIPPFTRRLLPTKPKKKSTRPYFSLGISSVQFQKALLHLVKSIFHSVTIKLLVSTTGEEESRLYSYDELQVQDKLVSSYILHAQLLSSIYQLFDCHLSIFYLPILETLLSSPLTFLHSKRTTPSRNLTSPYVQMVIATLETAKTQDLLDSLVAFDAQLVSVFSSIADNVETGMFSRSAISVRFPLQSSELVPLAMLSLHSGMNTSLVSSVSFSFLFSFFSFCLSLNVLVLSLLIQNFRFHLYNL